MPRLNRSKLNRLPPEERLKKLKEIEKEDKEEIKEIEKLIKRVESEVKAPKEIETPPPAEVSIERLFERESLEGTVQREAPAKEGTTVKYQGSQTEYETSEANAQQPIGKIEDSKYESATEETSKSTATRQTLKDLKKYDKG